MSQIYKVGGTDMYVALTDPASIRQIVTALKNEGLVKRNARIASFAVNTLNYHNMRLLEISHLGSHELILWPVD
ncbi:MAG: hypothetical protein EOO38_09775 [Cytophagaceae bacterium]|nr:MAG: hypothetical protein EOO38_09775 [Cytophagaceae bacterium]